MKKSEVRLATEIAFIALFLSLGIASIINGQSIHIQLDIFEWSQNKTALSDEIKEEVKNTRNYATGDSIMGVVFLFAAFGILSYMWFKAKED